MILYSYSVKVTSLFLNLICNLFVPIVEYVAYKFRIGETCACPPPQVSPRNRKKKVKLSKNSNGLSNGRNNHHNDVKRIKLLLNITVGQNGTKVLDIKARTRRAPNEKISEGCQTDPGLFVKLFNIPSSIVLCIIDKLRQWAHDLDMINNPACEDDRIKKSPKRRITRTNYRRMIPFFPFNLLGFSNYSAFQMPLITHSCAANIDDVHNLNLATSCTARCKRRRNSSTEESESESSLSDEDISYLEVPENSGGTTPSTLAVSGHDEVDSDDTGETGGTISKVASSSSSDAGDEPVLFSDEFVQTEEALVTVNTSSEDNCGNVTTMTDLDNCSVHSDEHKAVEFHDCYLEYLSP